MFTGLIQATGRVESLQAFATGSRIGIRPDHWGHRPGLGDSIAVSGVCLTVAAEPPPNGPEAGRLLFHAVPETLAKTTLGALKPGSRVNLEHACRPDTLLGGHIMQGHIEGVGRVIEAGTDPRDWRMEIETPAELMPCIVPKGSISVDGVSLTIASTTRRSFVVALIPTTLEKTTLASLRAGDAVNLETDVIARTVVNYMSHYLPPQGPAVP